MKKEMAVTVVVCGLLLSIIGHAVADPVTVTVGVADAPVTITNVRLLSGSNPVTTLDVITEYVVEFTTTSNNQMRRINNITVDLEDTAGATGTRSLYRFTIDPSLQSPTWSCNQGAQYYLGDPSLASYNRNAASHTFTLHFMLGKIARPSTTSGGRWHSNITATKFSGRTANDHSVHCNVNKYMEIVSQGNSINFGSVDPGASLTRQNVNFRVISNTELRVNVTGADLTESINGFTIPVGQFDMQRSDGSGQTVLSTSAQTIYSALVQTADTLGGLQGYNTDNTTLVSFGGTIPSPQPEGTYSGQWQFNITNPVVPT